MESQPKKIREYTKSDGSRPFTQWLDGLRDRVVITDLLVRVCANSRSIMVRVIEFILGKLALWWCGGAVAVWW